jgi:hypothetical protein
MNKPQNAAKGGETPRQKKGPRTVHRVILSPANNPLSVPFRVVSYRFYGETHWTSGEYRIIDEPSYFRVFLNGPTSDSISKRFEHTMREMIRDDERSGRSKSYEELLETRSLYVFQQTKDERSKVNWYGVFQLAKDGTVEKFSYEKECKGKEWPKAESSSKARLLTLPIQDGTGQQLFYYFFLSRVTLPKLVIDYLLNKIRTSDSKREILPKVDLQAELQLVSDQSGTTLLRVVDPIAIALNLHQIYSQTLDDRLDFSIPHKGLSSQQKREVELRLQKKALADILGRFSLSKELEKYEIDDDLAKTTGSYQHESFAKAYEDTMDELGTRIDDAAGSLVRWLDGDNAWNVVAKSYEVIADKHDKLAMSELLEYLRVVLGRLAESTAGRSYLAKMDTASTPQEKSSWVTKGIIRSYIIGDEDEPKWSSRVDVARKSWSSLLELTTELVEMKLTKIEEGIWPNAARWMAYSLNKKFNTTIFETMEETEKAMSVRRLDSSSNRRRVVLITLKKIDEKALEKSAEPWMNRSQEFAEMKSVKFLQAVQVMIEMVNFCIAIGTLGTDLGKSTNKMLAITNLLGSFSDLALAIELWKGTSIVARRVIGFVSAGFDIVLKSIDAVDMYRRGDMDAALGDALIVGGSIVFAYLYATGIGIASTGIGAKVGLIIAGIAIAVGAILRWLGRESELEEIVQHCYFGNQYGEDEAYKKWVGNLDLQLDALYRLLASVSFKGRDEPGLPCLRVYYGMTLMTSKFRIRFLESGPKASVADARLIIDMASKRVSEIDPRITVNRIQFSTENGRPYFDIILMNRKNKGDINDIIYYLHLDLDGKGDIIIPSYEYQYDLVRQKRVNTKKAP